MNTEQFSIKKSALTYGLILGGILALIVTAIYAINLTLMTQWWLGIIFFLIALAVGFVSVAKVKKMQGGFISFKEGFTAYFITVAVGLLINVLVSILIFVVVDPEAAIRLQESIMEVSRNMLESFGTPQDAIDEAMAEMESENSYSAANQAKGYVFQLLFYSIFGLLVALIMKSKDPNAIDA